jgi:outer membrane protein assembly factor BamB
MRTALFILAGLFWLEGCIGEQLTPVMPSLHCADGNTEVGDEKSAKREGPAEVPAVIIGEVKFTAIHWGKACQLDQNGGYVAATDVKSGRELWVLKIYSVNYDPRRESDTQDVFIVSLTKTEDGKLEVRDEIDRVFLVDPEKRTVTPR